MEIIQKTGRMEYYSSRLFERYFGGMRLGVFDIETMGLNPAHAEVILAGFLKISPDGRAESTQYFAQSKDEEPQLLQAVLREFEQYDVLLTYNGRHFDLPFILKRAALNGFGDIRTGVSNLDLYLILHGHSSLKQTVKSLRQKNVEDYMGLHKDRSDEISGAESIQLYESYLSDPDPESKEKKKQKILLHNHDDILQLYRILPVIQQADFHRAMSYLGFPVQASHCWPQLNLGRIRVDHRGLTATGTYGIPAGGKGFSYTSYDSGMAPYSCHFTPEGEFEFLFYTQRHKNSHFMELTPLLSGSRMTGLCRYPGYVNGFLILTEGTRTAHLELNMFVQSFLEQFMEETVFPGSL